MPDRFRILISSNVADQLQDIFQYIENNSPQNAYRLISRLITAIDSLESMPHRFKLLKNTHVFGAECAINAARTIFDPLSN